MQENKIKQLSIQLENLLTQERGKFNKLNKLEEEITKMQNYLFRPENMQLATEKQNLGEFIRKGEKDHLLKKSLDSSEEGGGVAITPALSRKIVNIVQEKSIMRKIARIEKIATRSLDILHEDGEFGCGWVAETAARENTDTPKLKKQTISTHELYAQPKATQSLINDAEINIENWLISRIADSFIKLENQVFINGDGVNKPHGLLENEHITRIDGGPSISAELLLHLINQLDESYLADAVFLMNRETLSTIQALKDANGRFIWHQSMNDPLSQTIFGVPVIISSNMPNIGEDNLAIAFGDFKSGYCIVEREHIQLMRDPFTEKPYVKFYAVKRLGGDVTNPKAIKFIRFAAE